jgi:hypothetical protein
MVIGTDFWVTSSPSSSHTMHRFVGNRQKKQFDGVCNHKPRRNCPHQGSLRSSRSMVG